jgi:DNA-binding transcriptional LysR family regulator
VRANNGDSLRQAAEGGHGIVLEPSFILHRSIEERTLIPILADFQWPTLYAHAVYPRTRHLSRRVRTFVDFLAERFAGVPYWDRCLQEDKGRAPATV